MRRWLLTLGVSLGALCGALAGCGSPAHTLGPVGAFSASPGRGDTGPLDRLEALEVPRNADISFEALWFAGSLAEPAPESSVPLEESVRMQVVLRLERDDDGVTAWPVGFDDLTDWGRALKRHRPDGRYLERLTSGRIGPVSARNIRALHILVSELEGGRSDEAAAGQRGGAALAWLPGPDREEDRRRLDRSEKQARQAGGDIELAVSLPVKLLPDATGPVEELRWLILIEAEPTRTGHAADRERLARVVRLAGLPGDGALPVVDAAGKHISAMTAIALVVRVHVGAPRNERQPGADDKKPPPRDDRPLRPKRITSTRVAPLQASLWFSPRRGLDKSSPIGDMKGRQGAVP